MEIDDNLVENAIRPTAIGNKNWLCVGESAAHQRGASLYLLIQNSRRPRIDPFAYLCDVLTRLPSMIPANWAQSANRPSQLAA